MVNLAKMGIFSFSIILEFCLHHAPGFESSLAALDLAPVFYLSGHDK